MGVTHGGVGDQHPLLVEHPPGETLGPQALEKLTRPLGRRRPQAGRHLRRRSRFRLRPPGDLRVAVDRHLGDEAQQAARPVAAAGKLEQLGRLVDEARRIVRRPEARVVDQALEKDQIGRHAADAELTQRPIHAVDGLLGCRRPGGDLLEQRVIVRGDHGARVRGAAIETDAEAGRPAVSGDTPVIGHEVGLRILGGDAALDGMAIEPDVVLRRHARGRRADLGALGQADLRLDDIDAGDLLGDRVLDLNPRVDLDEVEAALIHVHQELDRAGAEISDVTGETQRRLAQLASLGVVQVRRRRPLDHLLVTALDRTVAFEEMDDVAVFIPEDLHLDVTGPADEPLEVDLVAAKRGLRLAPAGLDLPRQVGFALDLAHAPAAAAPTGLQHQRIADGSGEFLDFGLIIWQLSCRRHHRHTGFLGQPARRNLVPQRPHGLGRGPDEDQPGRRAGLGELRFFGQETVTGMDRVGARQLSHTQHLIDRQIGLHRPQPDADPVALVRLEAVERQLVLLGVNGDRRDAGLGRRPHHADRDFTAIRD